MTEMTTAERETYNERYGKAKRYGMADSVAREDAWADVLRVRRANVLDEFEDIENHANVVSCECEGDGCPFCGGLGFISGWTGVGSSLAGSIVAIPCDEGQRERIAEWRALFRPLMSVGPREPSETGNME